MRGRRRKPSSFFSMADNSGVEFMTKSEMLSAFMLRLGFLFSPPAWVVAMSGVDQQNFFAEQSVLLEQLYRDVSSELNRRSSK